MRALPAGRDAGTRRYVASRTAVLLIRGLAMRGHPPRRRTRGTAE